MIKRDYYEDDYRIIEYENGTIVKQLAIKGNKEDEQITIPKSPIEELREEYQNLEKSIVELTMMIGGI